MGDTLRFGNLSGIRQVHGSGLWPVLVPAPSIRHYNVLILGTLD